MKIFLLGDSAVTIDFSDEKTDRGKLLERSLSAAAALERAKIPGVAEITSAYQSVSLFLDLPQLAAATKGETPAEFLEKKIRTVLAAKQKLKRKRARSIEIPVCYDEEFALDLKRVAEHTGLAPNEILSRHAAPEYQTACIGFLPGFPFLLGLDRKLETPRLEKPRLRVPAGSVAIATVQAGIYPVESPGGWNVIGRTPLRLFDATKDPPSLLLSGDRVRFRQIARDEFEQLAI